MAHLHIHQQKARIEAPLEYECASCGLRMDVIVRGMGIAGGLFPDDEEHAETAKTWAWKSAFMRCELWPCPHCGSRGYALWRREWIRVGVLVLLAMAATALIWWLTDSRAFRRAENIVIMLGIAVFFELLLCAAMLYELRVSKKAVRPLVNAGTDAT